MQLVCTREGRFGYHIGDTVEVPDDVDAFDYLYFRIADPESVAKAKAAAAAEKAAAEKNAKAEAKAEADKLAADLADNADSAKNESETV